MASRAFSASTALSPVTDESKYGFYIGSKLKRDSEEFAGMVIDRLSKLAQDAVTARRATEERWITDYRQYHGFYDPTTEKNLKNAGQSRAFVKITRAKAVTLEARLFDLLFPTDDKNWDISATPVPKLAKEAKEAEQRAKNAAEQANQAEAVGDHQTAGAIVGEGQDEAARAHAAANEIAVAKKAVDGMREEMEDQLIESRYPAHSRDLIHQSVIIGTGILKGPMVGERTRGRWLPEAANDQAERVENITNWKLEQGDDPRPLVRWVDAWSFFPDPSARRIDEAEYTFERHLWSKRELRKMVRTHGFDPDAVREIIRDDKKTVSTSPGLEYLVQLRSLTGEGDGKIIGRYVGWEYHGPLECDEMVALLHYVGEHELAFKYQEDDDPLREFNVLLYFCEDKLLKVSPDYPLDSNEPLYSVFNVEENEGSIFGYGVSHLIDSTQNMLNSAWRAGGDNMGLSVGPQAVIDKESIEPADGNWNMTPRKVWWRTKAAVPNAPDPVTFFNVPNNMNEIATIIKIALEFIDMETGIPMPQQGDNGAHTTQTVGGMAILQTAANIVFRRMVKNYDDGIIEPTMRRLYDWNMQHNQRSDIKGDMQVDARGSSVLLLKEVQAQNLMFIVTQLMANPAVAIMLKPYQNVVKLFQNMMIKPDDVMITEDEYTEAVKRQQESPPPPTPAEITAKARIDAANIAAQSSGVRDETTLMIARINERLALYEMASNHAISVQELQTRLAEKQIREEGEDRRMAAEVGAEAAMAEDARRHGEQPGGSGGYVSAGGEQEAPNNG